MHPQTFDIEQFDSQSDADAEGFTIPIKAEELAQVQGMNRKQRRAWAAAQKRNAKKGNP
jgi:acetyl-CoA acetyltransferase